MTRRRFLDLPELVLVLANLLPLFGVVRLGWDVGSLVVLYWAENLVIGVFTVLRMLVAGRMRALFPVLFFCCHYGIFCAIHGQFVLQLTGFAQVPVATPSELPFPLGDFVNLARQILQDAPPDFLRACLALLISHSASFLLLFVGRQEYRNATANRLMMAPYKRIALLHVAIITGGFLVQRMGSPLGLLVALVALKIAMDILLHRRSHAAAEQAAGKPAEPLAAPDEPA
jgi:hypothetical protein